MRRALRGALIAASSAAVAAMAATSVLADGPPPAQPAVITDFRAGNVAQMAERSALLARGEALLSEGDTAAAMEQLDRAAMMLHAPDTEMALVRAYLQAGDYRRALAFCAHTAGAHRETVAPSALYAWLLQLGGQGAYAARVLAEARTRAADDPLLIAAARELASPAPRADAVLLAGPQRMAPYALVRGSDGPLPARAEVVASGSVIDGGRHALVPLAALAQAQSIWLRNGLGETTSATLAQRIDDLGLALLALTRPLDVGSAPQAAARDPFAGSPGFAITYVATPDAAAAWPWLHAGFFGGLMRPDADSPERRLGIAMPPGPRGGPVVDGAGRLAGVAVASGNGEDGFVTITALRQALGSAVGPAVGQALGPAVAQASSDAAPAEAAAAPPLRAARMPNDELYERALRIAVQVIIAR